MSTTCTECLFPPAPSTPFDPADADASEFHFGDICTVFESADAPLEYVLVEKTPGLAERPHAMERSKRAYARHRTSNPKYRPTGKDRPCVMLSTTPVPRRATNVEICVWATLGRKPIAHCSLLHRLFVVQVGSPVDPLPTETTHIHTHPPWTTHEQKVIAVRYKTTREVKAFWPRGIEEKNSTMRPPSRTSLASRRSARGASTKDADSAPIYRLSRETAMWLLEECDRKLWAWTQRCIDDRNFGSVHEGDFRRLAAESRSQDSIRSNMSTKTARSQYRSSAVTPLATLHEVGNMVTAFATRSRSPTAGIKNVLHKVSRTSLRSVSRH
ncbi:hypothetical protein C8Q76DRAFT_791249 [Earliella scabrosa]|nr:hypothetical protein C8Q76DRAFT_791249 [Earliella scabrosa]